MAFRSPEQIRESAITFIDARLSGIRTETGEPIVDLIDAVAEEQGRLYTVAEYLRRINSIEGWSSTIDDTTFKTELADALGVSDTILNVQLARSLGVPDDLSNDIEAIIFFDLDRFAASYGKERKDATFSTTTERLFLTSSSPFTLLRGALIKVGGLNGVSFSTTDDLIGVLPSFDPVENQYFVDVGVRCQTAGIVGNQIVGAVNVVSPPIQFVNRARNIIPAEGGLPRQSNQQLLESLQNSLIGRDINTRQGLLNFVLGQPDVFDAIVIGPGDPLMTRAPAGAVDIYVVGSRLVTARVKTRIINAGEEFFFPYQPLRNFNAGTNISTPALYVQGSGLTIDVDTAEFADSAQANDKLTWDAITGPQPTEDVEVSFTYNGLLRDIQLQLDEDPQRNVPASSILIKEAQRIDVVLSMQVVVVPGKDQSIVEQAVQDALQSYFSLLRLGELVEFSTALAVAADTTINGIKVVDRIDDFLMGTLGSSLSSENIEAGKNQYARLFSIDFLSA